MAADRIALGSYECDVRSGHVSLSASLRQIAGLGDARTLSTAEFFDLVHPDDRPTVVAATNPAPGAKPPAALCRFRRPTGETRWTVLRAEAIRDDAGALVKVVGLVFDTTWGHDAYKTALAAMRDPHVAPEVFRDAPVALVVCTAERVLDVNDAFARLTGYAREDAGRQPGQDAGLWERFRFAEVVRRLSDEGRFADEVWRVRARDQRTHLVLVSAARTAHDGRPGVLVAFNEAVMRFEAQSLLTERERADVAALAEAEERGRRARAEAEVQRLGEQLRHAQRLEAIGRVAGGVAHDFNNMLMVINGYAEQLLRRLPEGDDLIALVMPIASAGKRGSELTQRLLAFSRQQVLAPRIMPANDIVRDLLPLLKPLVGERVTLALALDPRAGAVNVDPAQMEQVLMNLATNARDAMPAGGTITVETRNVTVSGEPGGPPPGPYVEIVVRDTGHGIDADQQAHMFEPFFTTKERGRGTGLGLPMAYGIIKQSGGDVRVESVVGAGTAMRIHLPAASGTPAPPSTAAGPAEGVAPGGSETVLLVEDDENVRDLVRDFLQGAGYRVIEAGDGVEAESKCRAEHGRIDLLLSDVVLPGLDGPSLSARLRAIVPGLKTLLMSGYPGGATVRPSAESGTTFVAKPFSRATLLGKVRQALSSAS